MACLALEMEKDTGVGSSPNCQILSLRSLEFAVLFGRREKALGKMALLESPEWPDSYPVLLDGRDNHLLNLRLHRVGSVRMRCETNPPNADKTLCLKAI